MNIIITDTPKYILNLTKINERATSGSSTPASPTDTLVTIEDLISQDAPNRLKLGSDGKLLASTETLTKTAINQAIGSYRAVIAVGENSCDYANSSDVLHFDRLLGLTTHAAAQNTTINILRQGEISDTSWSFIANKPVFVADNGLITQTPVTAGFNQQIGVALTPTKLLIKLYQPILLN